MSLTRVATCNATLMCSGYSSPRRRLRHYPLFAFRAANDTPIIIVQNHGGFLSSSSTVTVAVYQDGTLLERRDNEESSCRLLGSRELAILSMIMDRHHAVELLEGEHVDRCCISEDRPFVYWQIGVKAYRRRNNGGQLLPLARDLDRFFRTYLGDRNYVTPFMELRR